MVEETKAEIKETKTEIKSLQTGQSKIKFKLNMFQVVVIILFVISFVSIGYIWMSVNNINKWISAITTQTGNGGGTQNNTIIPSVGFGENPGLGSDSATLNMIEFADYQCPYCSMVQPTLDAVLQAHPEIKFYFRNFPLPPSLHPYANQSAIAAECANVQGKFWAMHDALYTNQSALDTASLESTAAKLGLNTATFNSCLTSPSSTIMNEITTDLSDGQGYGVSGTPTFFIGNSAKGYTMVVGAQPQSAFESAISSMK